MIADEAHRSQYGFVDGFARHMRDALPNASFIGFTGTPLELEDRSTRAVFGDYISIYDIQRAVEDKATVPIYYESRLAKLDLPEELKPRIDEEFEDVTEGEEVERKERLKTKWAQLEAVVGAAERIRLVGRDIVEHFERRLEALDGKAMVVCMSRRICVGLYNEIVRLLKTCTSRISRICECGAGRSSPAHLVQRLLCLCGQLRRGKVSCPDVCLLWARLTPVALAWEKVR